MSHFLELISSLACRTQARGATHLEINLDLAPNPCHLDLDLDLVWICSLALG